MVQTAQIERRTSPRLPLLLAGVAAIGIVKAAAWLYWHRAQPDADAQAARRLQPRIKA